LGRPGSVPAPLVGNQVEAKILAALLQARSHHELLVASPERLRELVRELPFVMRSTFGGNTTCVEVRCNDRTFVLDMGTGLRELGVSWCRQKIVPQQCVILQSHLHGDHIDGFPFWKQFYIPRSTFAAPIQMCGGTQGGASLQEALQSVMSPPEFPVNFETERVRGMPIHFRPLFDGWAADFGAVRVLARGLHHPQDCYGFRIEFGGHVVAFTTDHEPYCSNDVPSGLRELVSGADLWITDCQYSLEEYKSKMGWGHSFPEYIAHVAVVCGARRIVTTHHDPESSDERIERLAADVRDVSIIPTCAAFEGLEIEVT